MIAGIDPGLSGGVALLEAGRDVACTPMPLVDDGIIDIRKLRSLVEFCELVVIEQVSTRPGLSAKAVLTTGINYGIIAGVVMCLGIKLKTVRPQEWKAKVLKGTAKDKQAAIEYVNSMYPEVSLLATDRSRKAHDGMADAICIAEYGRQFVLR